MTFRSLWDHIPEGSKHALDALSLATLLGSLIDMLPSIATLLTIIWTLIRMYDEPRVQAAIACIRKWVRPNG